MCIRDSARTAFELFQKNYNWEHPIRSLGVRGCDLVSEEMPYQLDLFIDVYKRQGYYSEKNLGEIQMTLTTDMNALESSAMSVVENILGSLIYAAICTCLLYTSRCV